MEFVEKNKWAIICSIVALVLILIGAVNVIINILFFVTALMVGIYIDRAPEKIKDFFEKIKNEKETKEAEKVEDNNK